MVSETVKFNHEAGSIYSVFGLTKQRALELTGSIFFTEIDKAYMAHKLFDDPNEAPAQFTTRTGVLDTVLGDVKNDNEALFVTYEWGKHLTLTAVDEKYQATAGLLTMVYMMVDQDKDKFIEHFVNKTDMVD